MAVSPVGETIRSQAPGARILLLKGGERGGSFHASLVAVVALLLGALISSIVWGLSERNRADAPATDGGTSEEQIAEGSSIPILSA
jgi:hypothetical protein